MANSYEVIQYKQTALSLIVNDTELIHLIDNKAVEYSDDLIWVNIFPYMKVPQTEQEQKTYILMSVDMPNNTNRNNLMKDMIITFVVAAHQDLMKVEGKVGTRVDLLSYKIDKLFNGQDVFGIWDLKLMSNSEGRLDKLYPCRTLKFKVMDFDNRIL